MSTKKQSTATTVTTVTAIAAAADLESASFSVIKHAIARQFETMKPHQLFRSRIEKDMLWETYLHSFPPGTNPMFRERTDHDCQCCKSFIRNMGGVVAIVDGRAVSIWDFPATGTFYDQVGGYMAELVHAAAIDNIFLHPENSVGTEKSFEEVAGAVKSWEHFHLHLPASAIAKEIDISPRLADARATFDVLKRGLDELTLDAIDTVLELIAQNSLYKGEENKFAVDGFRDIKQQFAALGSGIRADEFCWYFALSKLAPSILRIRNTSIGQLLIDLSARMEMEQAVAGFEAMVAPANYKRPTALVTKAMIEKARATIESLGYTSALERRYATISDITINNVLFADRKSTSLHRDAFDELAAGVAIPSRTFDRAEEVAVDRFIADILPRAESLEVLLENRHAANLVSLVAPVDPGSKSMFKWHNNFSWSYAGDVTDSIKERVKRAGGSVTGDLCCRLAWDYADDLDFHMVEPTLGSHIYYPNKRQLSFNGGMLDLDANGSDGQRAEPVENIFYATKRTMAEGSYVLKVNNYNRRSAGTGFEVEVEFDGQTYNFAYDKVLRTGETVVVATIRYSAKKGFEVESALTSTQSSKQVWGLATQQFHKVNVVMQSPNYWDGSGVGNRHLFLMLDGARNELGARGFYNEFLRSELDPHRKVLEMVGSRMRTDESDRQLSGVGFSSTRRDSVTVRVKGSFSRAVKVMF